MRYSSQHINSSSRVLVKVGDTETYRRDKGEYVTIHSNKIYIINMMPYIKGYSPQGCVVWYGTMGKKLRTHTYYDKTVYEMVDLKAERGERGREQKYEEVSRAYNKAFDCPGCEGPVYQLRHRINEHVHVCIDCGQHIDSRDQFALAIAEAASNPKPERRTW